MFLPYHLTRLLLRLISLAQRTTIHFKLPFSLPKNKIYLPQAIEPGFFPLPEYRCTLCKTCSTHVTVFEPHKSVVSDDPLLSLVVLCVIFDIFWQVLIKGCHQSKTLLLLHLNGFEWQLIDLHNNPTPKKHTRTSWFLKKVICMLSHQ